MSLPVLQPARRQRRRRAQLLRPLLAVGGLTALAALLALVTFLGVRLFGSDGGASGRATTARLAKAKPHVRATRRPAPPATLISARALVSTPFDPPLSAQAAIVIEGSTGRAIWKANAALRLPIASTTKIMTAHLVLSHIPLRRVVRVDRGVTRVPLVKEGLRPGERVPVWKLLDGLLLYSGNDDAFALAVATSGSRPAFVRLMNDEARRLGLTHTHFRGPSGVIDRDNYSTAADLASLTRVALTDPRFRRIVRQPIAHVAWAAPTYAKIYVNKNKLLHLYRGANGVKTGWTTKAGHCLVASATRNGRTLIAVVLHSDRPYNDAARLLNLGFRTGSP